MPSNKILGIDLGTTNSAFAIVEAGEPEIIVNSEGGRTTPSVVNFDESGEVIVGKPAKNKVVKEPNRTIQSIKHHMGDEDHTVEIDGEEFVPEEVSAKTLQKIRSDAEDYLGEEIDRAVITVPAYFNDKQRNATKDAGEIAGLEVERIINEPTAASMAYGFDDDKDEKVLVYDLGGGTFDVSILHITGGVYEVISTSGDNELGGDDWDQALIDHVADEFEEEHGVDLREDPQSLQRLKEACQEAKHELSSRMQTRVTLPFISQTEDNEPLDLDTEISRSEFEEMTRELVDRTVEPMEQAIDDADLIKEDIGEVILVGGSTRMPMVHDTVEQVVDIEPKNEVNPDEAVGLGAAIQGGTIADDFEDTDAGDIVLIDVAPLSLGVETKGGLFEKIIEKNTSIPADNSKVFTTADDGQESVQIRVFQGEREIAEDNELLDEFTLSDIPPAKRGVPEIEVEFSIDVNGIVSVSAVDKSSGNEKTVQVEGGAGLSDEDIEQMKKEAEEKREEDMRKREEIEARNQAESSIRKASVLIEDAEEEGIDSGIIQNVHDAVDEVEQSLNEDASVDELEDKMDNLDTEMSKLGGEMY